MVAGRGALGHDRGPIRITLGGRRLWSGETDFHGPVAP